MIRLIVKQLINKPLLNHHRQLFSNCPQGFSLFPIETYDYGQRLDRYLKVTTIGWVSAQKHLRNGNIKVITAEGKIITKNNHKFEEGDQLILKEGLGLEQLLIGDKNPRHIQMDFDKSKKTLDDMLVFDNENVTIVNKPIGYSVQGGPDPTHNLFSLMAARYRKEMVYISHRLDKPTSGLVVLPKNLKTAQHLGKAFESRVGIEKYYLAVTEGHQIHQKRGIIANHLEWTTKHKMKMSEQIGGNERSQFSETAYVRLKQAELSDILWRHLIGIKLLTGRKHQIRCHLSEYLLNPILNDTHYKGRIDKEAGQAIFLHAFGLKIHSKELMEEVFKVDFKENRVLSQNDKGVVQKSEEGIQIVAFPPSFWDKYQAKLSQSSLKKIIVIIDRTQGSMPQLKETNVKS